MPRLLLPFSTAVAALALVACAWSVPADPGLNAARRSPDAYAASAPAGGLAQGQTLSGPGADDPVARSLYAQHCGRCHALFAPRHLSAEAWPAMVRSMAPRAGLFGANRERVAAWLVANAR
jgi:hypothetical protein